MTRFFVFALAGLAACAPDPSEVAPQPPSDDVDRVVEEASSVLEGVDLDRVRIGTDLGTPTEVITSSDGSMELGLTADVLFLRLSEEARKNVSEEIDQETENVEGLGGQIARAVTDAVEAGLGMATQIPRSEIEAIRVEDGRIVIAMADGEPSPFARSKTNDRPLLESFEAADAQRLADAFSDL